MTSAPSPVRRPGTRLVHALPLGAKSIVLPDGTFIVVQPDAPPYMVRPGGTIMDYDHATLQWVERAS